jgi:hypothetical protein
VADSGCSWSGDLKKRVCTWLGGHRAGDGGAIGTLSQCSQRWGSDLLAEKLASVWTGGVEGRKGTCPTKKERRERSDRSGERC